MCTRHFTAQERPEALYLDYAKPVNCLNSRKVLQLGMTVEMPLLRFECIQISRQLVRLSRRIGSWRRAACPVLRYDVVIDPLVPIRCHLS